MVIQRIQSLYLLLSAIFMALLCFIVPVAETPADIDGAYACFYISDFLPLLVLNGIIVVLLLVTIFLYKKLPLQMKVTRICIVLIIVSALLEAFMLYSQSQVGAVEVKWVGSAGLIIPSLLLTILALNGMSHDHKLLKSYDRLR